MNATDPESLAAQDWDVVIAGAAMPRCVPPSRPPRPARKC